MNKNIKKKKKNQVSIIPGAKGWDLHSIDYWAQLRFLHWSSGLLALPKARVRNAGCGSPERAALTGIAADTELGSASRVQGMQDGDVQGLAAPGGLSGLQWAANLVWICSLLYVAPIHHVLADWGTAEMQILLRQSALQALTIISSPLLVSCSSCAVGQDASQFETRDLQIGLLDSSGYRTASQSSVASFFLF